MLTRSTFRPSADLALDDLVRDELQFLLQVGERAAHEPLDAEDGVLGVGQRRSRAADADQDGAVVVEADAARHERDALGVADDDRPAVLDVGGEAEGGSQVDADDGGGGHANSVRLRPREFLISVSVSLIRNMTISSSQYIRTTRM